MTTTLSLLINAVAVVDPGQMDYDDQDVSGLYRVDLDLETVIGLSMGKCASMALDVFHSSVPVSVLDDFCFVVLTEDTRTPIQQDQDHEDYSASQCGDIEKISDAPLEHG